MPERVDPDFHLQFFAAPLLQLMQGQIILRRNPLFDFLVMALETGSPIATHFFWSHASRALLQFPVPLHAALGEAKPSRYLRRTVSCSSACHNLFSQLSMTRLHSPDYNLSW